MSFESLLPKSLVSDYLLKHDQVFKVSQGSSNDELDSVRKNRFPNILSSTLGSFTRSQEMLHTFLNSHPHLKGVEFVERMLDHFEFSFQAQWNEKERIPTEGRVIIVANHPLGSLDAAALFKLVSDIRSDVKVVVEQGVNEIDALNPITLPYISGAHKLNRDEAQFEQACQINQQPRKHLDNDGALIIFPCDEISRIRPSGVSDTKWRSDFLRLAKDTDSPILPIYIDAANSALFYGVSAISKPLSSLMVVPEMYKQTNKSVDIRIGKLISPEAFSGSVLPVKTQVKLFKKHLYKIGKGKQGIWPTQSPVAHPEPRQMLKNLIASQDHLGETADAKQIYLYQNEGSCAVLREIGRLREIAFRAVGEGTGERRDIDKYDATYSQLVLWDDKDLEVVGAYRMARAADLIEQGGIASLYSASLFDYHESVLPKVMQGVELGRSFVQPKYWGKRSLDYLWYGIGSYLSRNPDVRYLFGPVSISNDMPKAAKDLLVYFFTLYFGSFDDVSSVPLARSRNPYHLSNELVSELSKNFSGTDYKEDFIVLKNILSNMGCSVPTLYKQYSDLCEPGGMQFLGFGVDPDFGDCIDGLVMVDVTKIKAKKRKRYIPFEEAPVLNS